MQTEALTSISPAETLSKAVVNAAHDLGINQSQLGKILGRDRSSISRGIDPASKPGELALMLVRCYRALAVLVGQDVATMKHWFTTHNIHTGGIPRQQVMSIQGLVQVTEYLDAMRGKV